MFEILKITLYGRQPTAKITDKMLERLIQREFSERAGQVKRKLEGVKGETPNGTNRNAAAILKLANKDYDTIDQLIAVNNNDFRDVIAPAEYPKCLELGFVDFPKDVEERKRIYLADWRQYAEWLRKT